VLRAGSSRPEQAARVHAERRRYEEIIDRYLTHCYAEKTPARTTELAELLGGARMHISRVIHTIFGMTLAHVLREKQLAEAKRLLEGAMPLSMDEIAASSGFGDRTTLFRRFRDAYGFAPSEYRARHRSQHKPLVRV
jgi:transcriptional regulator GlxA family with amidase domain